MQLISILLLIIVLHWGCIFLVIFCYLQSGKALTCLNCDAVSHPRLCTHVTKCFAGEKCGMETFISADGDVQYNLGCVDSSTCSSRAPPTNTDGHQYFSCNHCCDDNNLCNAHGCNSTGFPINRGPICFNCEAFPEGYPCHKITHCETHEVCFNDAHLEFQTDMLYSSGCRSKHHCASETVDPQNFMGRRSVSVCTDCCNGDLCNIQCKQSSDCSDDPTCKLLMNNYDVCKSPDIAKQFCKKSCNMCANSSAPACTDTRVDCAHISSGTNICGTQQDAATYGCLKYCGFCSRTTAAALTFATASTIHGPVRTTQVPGSTTQGPVRTTLKPTTAMTSPARTTSSARTLSVGNQVIRGPDWMWGNQNNNGTGVVTAVNPGGWVTVRWNKDGFENSYRYGVLGKYDLKFYSSGGTAVPTTTMPTSTIPTTTVPTTAVPTTTVPTTTVPTTTVPTTAVPTTTVPTSVVPTTAVPTTTVPTTTQLPTTALPTTSQSKITLSVGNQVIRGPDWMWGNQDNNGTGVVTAVNPGGWVTVRWNKDGFENSYRYGVLGKYDVKFYSSGGTAVPATTVPTTTVPTTIVRTTPVPTTRIPTSTFPTTTQLPTTAVPTTPQSRRALLKGDHVIRGPDWTWRDQDGHTTGTVTGNSASGWVTVRWGNGFENSYRYGTNGKYDVVAVNRGYTSGAPPGTVTSLPLSGAVVVGDRVIPGPDWKYSNQGGNGTGRVILVDNQTGGTWVKVRWGDGSENFYRYGADGKYDVIKEKIGVATTVIPTSTASVYTFRVGDRVVRGPDWQWGNQDNGGMGTVTGVDPAGWVKVIWDNNFENSYRNGIMNFHDLLKVGSTGVTSAQTTQATTAPPTAGAGLASEMYIGAKVQRGKDWKYGNQDGNGPGSVRKLPPNVPTGWVQVEWDNGYVNNYRLGADNAYDIMFVPGSYNPSAS